MRFSLSRRAMLAWFALGPLIAGCARDRDLYRAANNPDLSPEDWYLGQGCDGSGLDRAGRRRHHRRHRHGGGHGSPCLDYRSAAEGYPDTHGGSRPPRRIPGPPSGRRGHRPR